MDIGTIPIVSDYQTVEICFDKYLFYKHLVEKGFKTPRSYIDKEKFYSDLESGLISFPVFVKPVRAVPVLH